jgi:serine protease
LLGLSMAVGFASGAFADGNGANVDGMHILGIRGGAPKAFGTGSNLQYHGGSIEATPKVYISWWGSAWSNGFSTGGYTSAQAQSYVTSFFGGVGGSSWNNSVTQYCQGTPVGSTSCSGSVVFVGNKSGMLGGTWNDTTPVPARPKQADIAAAAARLAQQMTGGPQPGATYFVFTPTGQSMSGFGTRWCAWHSSSGSMAYAYMPYIPDAGAGCGMNFVNSANDSFGNGYFDGFSVVGGHEMAEAETDPFPNSGWLDSSGSENGDKCAWSSSSGNISLGSNNSFAVQPLWSNNANGCVMSY